MFDEDRDRSADFLGKVAIPLLQVQEHTETAGNYHRCTGDDDRINLQWFLYFRSQTESRRVTS